jgi:hypothetical protein
VRVRKCWLLSQVQSRVGSTALASANHAQLCQSSSLLPITLSYVNQARFCKSRSAMSIKLASANHAQLCQSSSVLQIITCLDFAIKQSLTLQSITCLAFAIKHSSTLYFFLSFLTIYDSFFHFSPL